MTPHRDGTPWWARLLEQHGISTVLVLVAMWWVSMYGGRFVSAYIEERSLERAEMSKFLSAQVDATTALIEANEIERQFERLVTDVHEDQTAALTQVLQELKTANDHMAPVPSMRQKELELLKGIKDELERQGRLDRDHADSGPD